MQRHTALPKLIVLGMSIACLLLYHAFAYIGHYGFDDMEYAYQARELLKGNVDYSNHFSYRIAVIFFTAASYGVFGISDFSSSLPAMMLTIGCFIAIAAVLWKRGWLAICIALILCLASPWFLSYSDKLMSDMYIAFAVTISIFVYWRVLKSRGSDIANAACMILALFFGFAAKGSIILILPWLIFYFLRDIVQKKHRPFWYYTLAFGLLVLVAYFLVLYVLTGSPLARFKAIADNGYLNACSYDQLPLSFLLERLSTGFFGLAISTGLLTAFFLLIPAFTHWKRSDQRDVTLYYFGTSAIILLLSSNFMSMSYTAYVPMCLDQRHYLFLVPISSIPAALVVEKYLKGFEYKWSLPILATAGALCAYFFNADYFIKLFLPLSALIWLYAIPYFKKNLSLLFPILLCSIAFLKAYDFVVYATDVGYRHQQKIIKSLIENLPKDAILLTDTVQGRISFYHTDAKPDIRACYSVLNPGLFSMQSKNIYLLINPHTLYLSGIQQDDYPYFMSSADRYGEKLFQDKKSGIILYKFQELFFPDQNGTVLYHAFTDGEFGTGSFVNSSPQYTVIDSVKALNLVEYNNTIRLGLDSIDRLGKSGVLVLAKARIMSNRPSSGRLVVEISNSGGRIFREECYLGNRTNVEGVWNDVICSIPLPDSLPSDAELVVYIWNPDGDLKFLHRMDLRLVGI